MLKDNCLNEGIWIFFFSNFESLFSIWKFLIFIFSEKKEKEFPGNSTKVLKKIAGMLYKSLRRRKLFRLTFVFS